MDNLFLLLGRPFSELQGFSGSPPIVWLFCDIVVMMLLLENKYDDDDDALLLTRLTHGQLIAILAIRQRHISYAVGISSRHVSRLCNQCTNRTRIFDCWLGTAGQEMKLVNKFVFVFVLCSRLYSLTYDSGTVVAY